MDESEQTSPGADHGQREPRVDGRVPVPAVVGYPGRDRGAVAGVGLTEFGQTVPRGAGAHTGAASRAPGSSVVSPGSSSPPASLSAVQMATASADLAPIQPLGVRVMAVRIFGARMTTVRSR